MGLTPDFITLISHNLYLRSSRLIDSQVQQAPALIQIDVHRLHRLLTGDLRNFEWVPEDRCVEGRPGLQLIIDSIFNCAYPYDIDWQTHRRFLKYLSLLKPKYVGQTPEFDLLVLLTLAVVVASPLRELATSNLRSFPGDNLRLGLYNSTSIYVIYSQVLTNDNEISTCRRPSVIGKHHLGRCLYIFTMATILQNNMKIPLNFPSRTILILKPLLSLGLYQSTQLSFGLKLFNSTGDTLLYISVFKTRITFKDHANRSLGNGWGKEQTVDMNYTPTAMFGDTVSIHHYVTDSNFGRYQILVNGITVCHFDKRLPGSATQISYKDDSSRGEYSWGPSCWEVGVYQIGDLLPEDRLALVPGR